MVENNQALEAYKVWLNASEKYDYHIVGIAGALTAWGVQTLQLKALDWTVAVEVAGLAALATSAALGLYRIERSILIHSLSLQKAQLTIKSNEKCARERRNQEEIGSADYVGVEKWEAILYFQRVASRRRALLQIWGKLGAMRNSLPYEKTGRGRFFFALISVKSGELIHAFFIALAV